MVEVEGGAERELSPAEIIEFRFKQSWASRLAEHITGLRPNDPRMAERLVNDQLIIRGKYALPARAMRADNPTEYERFLRERAKQIGTEIKAKSECGGYFDGDGIAAGAYFDKGNFIGASLDKSTRPSYARGLGVLEHEFIHAEQGNKAASMPIELMEYEAYVAGLSPEALLERPDNLEIIFSYLIGGSVMHWYNEKNKERITTSPRVVQRSGAFSLRARNHRYRKHQRK